MKRFHTLITPTHLKWPTTEQWRSDNTYKTSTPKQKHVWTFSEYLKYIFRSHKGRHHLGVQTVNQTHHLIRTPLRELSTANTQIDCLQATQNFTLLIARGCTRPPQSATSIMKHVSSTAHAYERKTHLHLKRTPESSGVYRSSQRVGPHLLKKNRCAGGGSQG